MPKTIKVLLSIFCIIIFQTQLKAAEELGSQHTVGLGFLYNYEYSEPHLMHLRAGKSATSDTWANIGILYNYKNAFIKNGYLSCQNNHYKDWVIIKMIHIENCLY